MINEGTPPDPFRGSQLSAPGAVPVDPSDLSDMRNVFGDVNPLTDDPAWQPITDPLNAKIGPEIIYREIPNVNVQTGWTIAQTRQAVINLCGGMFEYPAQLIDSMLGDSRIQASLASINGGLFSRPLTWEAPPGFEDDDEAKNCLEVWQQQWPNVGTEAALSNAVTWDVFMGFWVAQILWDTSEDLWVPRLYPWHPRYMYYNWSLRKYVATTMDGQVAVEGGNGKWVLHAPHGEYRGWFNGAVRAVSPWWLARNYALRDAARFSERFGFPITKAKTPFGADPVMINAWRVALQRLGQESVVNTPQSPDSKIGGYDLEYVELKGGTAWEIFFRLIEQCNMEITLAIQAQNLTSEVKEGSLAAAREHGDVKQTLLQSKARGFCRTLHTQLARPFASFNFGRPEIAPIPKWDIKPIDDKKTLAGALVNLGQALNQLRQSGKLVRDVRALALQFGIDLGELDDVAPLQVEARAAGATGKVQDDASGSGGGEPTEPTKDDESDDDENQNET